MLRMNAIRTIRERLRMTQQALAGELGCTQGNVGHYERGQTVPPDVARRLIEASAQRGLCIGFDHVYGAAEIPQVDSQSAMSEPVAGA